MINLPGTDREYIILKIWDRLNKVQDRIHCNWYSSALIEASGYNINGDINFAV